MENISMNPRPLAVGDPRVPSNASDVSEVANERKPLWTGRQRKALVMPSEQSTNRKKDEHRCKRKTDERLHGRVESEGATANYSIYEVVNTTASSNIEGNGNETRKTLEFRA
ncbi:hypothetical protein PM082_020462 [Marasmius tenuissimus]|nr:hypothetical protein PM082_020462 [Marasmius tenuissimus]